jgi:hypothetical protein
MLRPRGGRRTSQASTASGSARTKNVHHVAVERADPLRARGKLTDLPEIAAYVLAHAASMLMIFLFLRRAMAVARGPT